MSDLISRQAAIDAILHITNCKSVRELFEYNQEHHLTEMWSGGVNDAIDAVIGVESATDTNVATKVSTNLAEVGTDCISRQAAIDAVARVMVIKSRGGRGNQIAEAVDSAKIIIADNILHLPPIQPKRGRWISADAIFGGVPFYCSECGENTRDTVMGKPRWNFCPNCGCRMDGGEQ